MKSNEVILSSIPLDEWKTLLLDCIKTERDSFPPPQIITPSNDLITENEARDFVKVSKVTLKKWRDEGKIPFYRIGTRIRYKKSELLTSLNTVRKYGRGEK